MARATDLAGIRQIIQPLEESGTLVRRTDEEVVSCSFRFTSITPSMMMRLSTPDRNKKRELILLFGVIMYNFG
jgi:hypothetical protein